MESAWTELPTWWWKSWVTKKTNRKRELRGRWSDITLSPFSPAEPRDCTTRTTSFREKKAKPLRNASQRSAEEVKTSTSVLSGGRWDVKPALKTWAGLKPIWRKRGLASPSKIVSLLAFSPKFSSLLFYHHSRSDVLWVIPHHQIKGSFRGWEATLWITVKGHEHLFNSLGTLSWPGFDTKESLLVRSWNGWANLSVKDRSQACSTSLEQRLTCTCRVSRLPDGSWRRRISPGACRWRFHPFLWAWRPSPYWQTAAATSRGRNLQSEQTQ